MPEKIEFTHPVSRHTFLDIKRELPFVRILVIFLQWKNTLLDQAFGNEQSGKND